MNMNVEAFREVCSESEKSFSPGEKPEKLAKQAFKERDAAKQKLRAAEATIAQFQSERLRALEPSRKSGLVEDIVIETVDGGMPYNVILSIIDHAESKDKVILRMDCPSQIVSSFRSYGRTQFDEATSREQLTGLVGHIYSMDVYLDNHIVPFKGEEMFTIKCNPTTNPMANHNPHVCRIYMAEVSPPPAPTQWMSN